MNEKELRLVPPTPRVTGEITNDQYITRVATEQARLMGAEYYDGGVPVMSMNLGHDRPEYEVFIIAFNCAIESLKAEARNHTQKQTNA